MQWYWKHLLSLYLQVMLTVLSKLQLVFSTDWFWNGNCLSSLTSSYLQQAFSKQENSILVSTKCGVSNRSSSLLWKFWANEENWWKCSGFINRRVWYDDKRVTCVLHLKLMQETLTRVPKDSVLHLVFECEQETWLCRCRRKQVKDH